MWDIIINLSKNLKKKNLLNINNNSSNYSDSSSQNIEIFESIKIFTLNNDLEYLCYISKPLTEENAEKIYLPLLYKCIKIRENSQECNLSKCLNTLLRTMHSDRRIFQENFKENNPDYYIDDNTLPQKNKFYRVLFFNGALTEIINLPSLENLIIDFKRKYNIVFNYYLFEYDYQYIKKINNIFLQHNLIDYKSSDFEIFMKKEIFDINEYNTFIQDFYKKLFHMEKLINDFIVSFNRTKSLFFGNPKFLDFQKKYDIEHSKLMKDYDIINKNRNKYFEFSKANINKEKTDYIKKNLSEMLNSKVISKLSNTVRNSIEFSKFYNIINGLITDTNTSFDALKTQINKALLVLNDLGNFIFLN
jgi:hypothetical protein